MTTSINQSVVSGELLEIYLFVFTDNIVSESVYYKCVLKSPMLFEIVLQLLQVQMKGCLIIRVIHIVGTRMEASGIDGISRGETWEA